MKSLTTLILLILSTSSLGWASGLRTDFEKEIGIGLDKVVASILHDDFNSKTMLLNATKSHDLDKLQATLAQHYEQELANCRATAASEAYCESSNQPLKESLNFYVRLRNQLEKSPKVANESNMLFATSTVQIKGIKFIEPRFLKWERDCKKQEKVNSANCRKTFKELSQLNSLINDLHALQMAKLERVNSNELKKRIQEQLNVINK